MVFEVLTMAYNVRQWDLVNMEKLSNLSATIIGCGAGWSLTAIALSKMGIGELTLYDMDIVKDENIGLQFFTVAQLGFNKAIATKELCEGFNPNVKVNAYSSEFVNQTLRSEIALAMTDTIESRDCVLRESENSQHCKLYIDARMNPKIVKVFTVNTKNKPSVDKFRQDFIKDVKNTETPCTARGIIFNALLSSTFCSNIVKRYVNNEALPKHIAFDLVTGYTIMDL